uniref:Uncharacterized protein n=1 Tax=Trichogramma kaykai TaxID=54128 RepID=A0ABD2VW16_9HYME
MGESESSLACVRSPREAAHLFQGAPCQFLPDAIVAAVADHRGGKDEAQSDDDGFVPGAERASQEEPAATIRTSSQPTSPRRSSRPGSEQHGILFSARSNRATL